MGSTWKEQQQDGMPEIPGYRLMRILGHGGMSTVYLGQQLSLGREVAIKVMRQEALTDETGRRRKWLRRCTIGAGSNSSCNCGTPRKRLIFADSRMIQSSE